ncbi:hypothetical protein [Buttiauxella sp. 3AFRM03]|uniref:hypothetical protein n=1 Tax=Buttiauxella sp. 3AFRM03 TaxID=2479367 RepID=UPI0026C6BB16
MHSLKKTPPLYSRPAPLKLGRWFYSLIIIISLSVIIMRMFGGYIKSHDFWLIALGIPVSCWFIVGTAYVVIWMLKDIKASGYNRQREKWILSETRKSRRALQVLSTSLISGHNLKDKNDILNSLIKNKGIISSQQDRVGNEGVRLSRIPDSNDSLTEVILNIFQKLIEKLPLDYIPDNTHLVIALDTSSIISQQNINELWLQSWGEFGSLHSFNLIESKGLGILDHWLNTRIKENSLLLVVALQVAPINADNSAEAAVALLLGNRLTQESISPQALLHRPDPSPVEELESGMLMAAYNVPIKDGIVKHLWLSGLNDQQHAAVVIHQKKPPAQAVEGEAVINLDSSMGHAGAAAPWLAIAAAAEHAQQTLSPQMIICGDTSQDVLWCTLVTPTASRQEMDS